MQYATSCESCAVCYKRLELCSVIRALGAVRAMHVWQGLACKAGMGFSWRIDYKALLDCSTGLCEERGARTARLTTVLLSHLFFLLSELFLITAIHLKFSFDLSLM